MSEKLNDGTEVPNGFVRKTGTGTVEEYQGKKLATPVTYNFDWAEPNSPQVAKDNALWPGDDKIFVIVKQNAERSAKSSAYQAAIKPLKDAYEASNEYKVAQFVKAAVAMGMSEAQAQALAEGKL